MTAPTIKTDNTKSNAIVLLENALFICCIIVIVLRTTFTEAPTPQPAKIQSIINDPVYSLCMSAVLIFASLLWLLARLFGKRFSYRTTAMEIGLVILLLGAILATLYAANKRAAISSSLTLLAPIFMAILLAQLLDSNAKIKILLIVITSLGIVAAWQSAEQFFVSNNVMIEQYKEDPDSILKPLGIQPGTLNHMLLEHRIYSKDVRASFTTSNSAGSFGILASFASIALLAERLKNRKVSPASLGNLVLAAFALAAVLFGLFLTRSKGAIVAFFIAAAVFAWLLQSNRPGISKNIILAACIIGLLALAPVIAWYGLKFGRLPGGNAMLVRWQYWQASAQMAADHPLTGVGPGNFACFYHQYKPSSAPETVSDPHCFVLSILTQYGPFGLLGFLAIILLPLWRASLAEPSTVLRAGPSATKSPPGLQFRNLATVCIIAPIAAMLLLRPFLLPPSFADDFFDKLYVFSTAYTMPAAAFIVGCALLIKSLQSSCGSPPGTGRGPDVTIRKRESVLRSSSRLTTAAAADGYALQNTAVTTAALFAGLLGVLIHNLIDFAIFEPGVLTVFCASLACLIALSSQTSPLPKPILAAPGWLKAVAIVSFLILCCGYFNYALLPVAKSTAKIAKTGKPIEFGQFQLAHNLLAAATLDDPLSPDAPSMNGWLFLQQSYSPNPQQSQLLDNAEQALFIAAERNPADFKNFESLSEVYFLLARLQPDQNDQWLAKALDSTSITVSLYPGNAESHLRLAQAADELGRTDTALKHYQTAVQIEDGFRKQFLLMYPGRNVFSRLGEEKYLFAKERIKVLTSKSPQ
jgi:Tfp pilus assembly protein PilF